MKYMNGKEVMKNDIALISVDGTCFAGNVHQLRDRTSQFLMGTYPLPVHSETALLASDCFDALAIPTREAKAKAAKEASEAAAKAQNQSGDTNTPPDKQNAS